MAPLPPAALTPRPGEQGIVSGDLSLLARDTVRAWELFAESIDPADSGSGRTRSSSRTARDLVIEVGRWPDSRGAWDMSASAERVDWQQDESDFDTRRLIGSHADADVAEVRSAVARALDEVRAWFAEADVPSLSPRIVGSLVGPVPLGTLLYGAAFQLAVTSRDLYPAGAQPIEELDELGLRALIDTSGAVAARVGTDAALTGITPDQVVGCGASRDGSWCTRFLQPEDDFGPAVEAPAGLIIDLACGRVQFGQVLRQVRLRKPHQMRAMAVILEDLPHLPSGDALRRAVRLARTMRVL